MTSSARSRVASNAATGTLAQVITIVIGLVTTPMILRRLGATDYGAFALIGSLSAYFGILDLGIGGSLTRFMSFHHERDDRARVGAFAAFGLLFYLALGAVLLPALVAAAPAIGRFLALPPDLLARFPTLLALVAGLFVGWSLSGVVAARLIAAHRLDVTAIANVGGSLVFAALVWIVLPARPSVEVVFACMAGQLAATALILFAANRRLNGRLLASPGRLSRAEAREMFAFGLWSQLSNVTAVINLEADKAVISHAIGVNSVTPYHVANRLAMLSRALPLQLLSSLLPALTAQVSGGLAPDEVAGLYARTSRNLMVATLVIVGFVAGAADALLRLWLGQRVPGAAVLCAALVASYAVNNVTGAGTTILRAQGRPQLETFYGTLSAVLNIALTVALIRPFGLFGVVMGTIGGNVVGSTVFVVLFHRRERIGWWPTMGRWLTRLAAITAATAGLAHLLLGWLVPLTTDRLVLLPAIAAAGLGYLAAYWLLGRLVALWTLDDLAMLDRIAARLRPRRRPA